MLATRMVMSVFTTRMMVTVRVTRTKMLFLIVFLNLIPVRCKGSAFAGVGNKVFFRFRLGSLEFFLRFRVHVDKF